MGRSSSWIAIKPAKRDEFLRVFKLTEDSSSKPFGNASMIGDWFVFEVSRAGCESALTNEVAAERFSKGSHAVRWQVDEHVMCADAGGWTDGRCVWEINYDGQTNELTDGGELPAAYAGIARDSRKQQKEANRTQSDSEDAQQVDCIFEVVENTVAAFLGCDVEAMSLENAQGFKRPPLWKRLFSG